MNRDAILEANPLLPFLRARGIPLRQSADNFLTSSCPHTKHTPGHQCVTVYQNNSWFCHDCSLGGTIIDWLVHEKGLTPAQAIAELSPAPEGPTPRRKGAANASKEAEGQKIVAQYDYTDVAGNLLYQQLRFFPKDFRPRQPCTTSKDGWKWDLQGVTRVLFRLPHVAAASDVIVVEGEKDVLSLELLGYTATTNFGGANGWLPQYWNTLANKNVTVIPDNDKDGNTWLHDLLAQPQAASLKILHLPSPFKDTTDFLSSFSSKSEAADAFSSLLHQARYCGLPPIADLANLLNGTRPPLPPQLITGLLHQGSKMVIGGTSKGRKTFCLIDLAISVATGTPWWGFHCTQGKVCYINFELQDAFFVARAEAILNAKNLSLPPNTLFPWNLRGHANDIENLVEEIISRLLSYHFILIVVDPVYKALGRKDENKAGDVAQMLNQLEHVAVETGAAVVFGAHYSKGNQAAKDSIDRIGGSGVFARDPDSILTMTAHDQPDCFTVDSTLRNFPPLDPFVLNWSYPTFSRDPSLNPQNLKRLPNRSGQFQSLYSPDLFTNRLEVHSGTKPKDLLADLQESEGIGTAQFWRISKDLRDKGKIISKNKLWFLAP